MYIVACSSVGMCDISRTFRSCGFVVTCAVCIAIMRDLLARISVLFKKKMHLLKTVHKLVIIERTDRKMHASAIRERTCLLMMLTF